ncbi:MAG: phosphoribosyltransferase family protein [Bacteroidota bacterium]
MFQKFASEPKISSAQAFISFYQHGIAQKLLHHLKYKGVQDLGKVLGRWFAPQLMELELDFIIPIPLHHKKQRKRGYNQSQLIAEGLSEQLEIPVKSTLVSREINTRSQTRKSKLQRWQDMENIYSRISADLGGKKILVVDDVVTTGATVSMLCARLVEAGASEIHVACIARGV